MGSGKGIVTVDVSEGSGVDDPPPNKDGNKMVNIPLPTSMAKIIPQVINDCLFFKILSPQILLIPAANAAGDDIYYHK